jgi:hypothetical protein
METVSFSIRANPQFGLLIGRVFTTKRGRGSFGFMRGFRGGPAEELVPSRWSIAREKIYKIRQVKQRRVRSIFGWVAAKKAYSLGISFFTRWTFCNIYGKGVVLGSFLPLSDLFRSLESVSLLALICEFVRCDPFDSDI